MLEPRRRPQGNKMAGFSAGEWFLARLDLGEWLKTAYRTIRSWLQKERELYGILDKAIGLGYHRVRFNLRGGTYGR